MLTKLPALARYITDPAIQVPDGEYLRRFVESRDEEAFAELVRRNGPLVLRACRSVLRDPGAIEDAFQNAFLQLARHATSLISSQSTAGWLHKAAVRAASAIRRSETRRRRRELLARPITDTPPPVDPTWLEVREAIDAELTLLPEKYRLPLLLCYIEGLSYGDAATRLGCSHGTLRGRLERGRRQLRSRLKARGLPEVALPLCACTCPVVSAGLRERTLSAVRSFGQRPQAFINWDALTLPHRVFWTGCVVVFAAVGMGLAAFNNSTEPPESTPPAIAQAPPVVSAKQPDVSLDAFGDPLPKGAIARLGTTRFLEYSQDFALSPDGKTIAVGDGDKEQHFTHLDAETGKVLRQQANIRVGGYFKFPRKGEGKGTSTTGIFWRPDGRGVALVGWFPGDKYLWEFTDPKDIPPTFKPGPNDQAPPEPPEGAISCAALSADGASIAIARQSSNPERRVIQVYPCKTGKSLSELKAERTFGPFPTDCERLWFAAAGKELVLARADQTVVAIEAANGKELHRATLPKWAGIALSPDGKFVAIIPRPEKKDSFQWPTGEETVRVWDLTAGKEVWNFPRPGKAVSGIAFTTDSMQLITSDSEFDYRRWDLASGKVVASRQLSNRRDWESAVSVSADGRYQATARSDTPVRVWDTESGKQLNRLPTHQDIVRGVAVSPDSRLAATVGDDGTMRVWNVANGKQVCTGSAPWANPSNSIYDDRRAIAFTPDGRNVLFDAAGGVAMADAATGKSLELPGGLKRLSCTLGGFSADGKSLVTYSGNTATVWSWPAGTSRQTFQVEIEKSKLKGPIPKGPVASEIKNAALSPDGSTLLIVSDLSELSDRVNSNDCWDVKTGKRRFRFTPDLLNPKFAFSPDGRTIYAGGQPTDPTGEGRHNLLRRDALVSLDAATGAVIRRFEDPLYDPKVIEPDPSRHIRLVHALTLSPDGRLLAVSENHSEAVWIYETASGRVIKRFNGHSSKTYNLAFTPDGSKLISVSSDNTGLVWDVTLPALTDRKAGPLSPKELTDSWNRLTAPDPVLAWRAIADLAGSPARGEHHSDSIRS